MTDRPIRDAGVRRGRGRPEISWPARRPRPDRETIRSLQERAKELDCLYRVDEILRRTDAPVEEVLAAIITVLPPGWQYPAACQARIVWRGRSFASPGYVQTEWRQTAPLRLGGAEVGLVEVSYTAEMAEADEGPFLKEEARLISTIAERVGDFLLQRGTEAARE